MRSASMMTSAEVREFGTAKHTLPRIENLTLTTNFDLYTEDGDTTSVTIELGKASFASRPELSLPDLRLLVSVMETHQNLADQQQQIMSAKLDEDAEVLAEIEGHLSRHIKTIEDL